MSEAVEVFDWQGALLQHEWEEGKVFPLVWVPYRYRVMVTCTSVGRQTAEFANGAFNYFEHEEITRPDGSWGSQGNVIVPVLPDGRLLMVVEQRPPQYQFPNQPTHIELAYGRVALADFGPYSVLEFPGGGVEPGETYTSGFFHELLDETGIPEQFATLFWCARPHHPLVSDVADEKHVGAILLSRGVFKEYVRTDGGLHALALTREEVRENIHRGVIRSVHVGHFPFTFYEEVMDASVRELQRMQDVGYLEIRRVMVKR